MISLCRPWDRVHLGTWGFPCLIDEELIKQALFLGLQPSWWQNPHITFMHILNCSPEAKSSTLCELNGKLRRWAVATGKGWTRAIVCLELLNFLWGSLRKMFLGLRIIDFWIRMDLRGYQNLLPRVEMPSAVTLINGYIQLFFMFSLWQGAHCSLRPSFIFRKQKAYVSKCFLYSWSKI